MERLIVFKFTADQLRQFQNASNTSHITTNVQQTTYIHPVVDKLCAWCMNIIVGPTKHIYIDLDATTRDKIGQFCDNWICQLAYNKVYCKGKNWEYIRTEIYKSTGKQLSIVYYPDPPQILLQKFGGKFTVDEYNTYIYQLEKSIGL